MMRCHRRAFLLIAVLCFSCHEGSAHETDGPPIPAADNVVVDGSFSDWAAILPDPLLTEQDFISVSIDNGEEYVPISPDPYSIRLQIWLGWKATKVCGFVQRWDDVHIDEMLPQYEDGPRYLNYAYDNDSFSIFVDGDHSGGTIESLDHGDEEFPLYTYQVFNFLVGSNAARSVDVNEDSFFDWPALPPWTEHVAKLEPQDRGVLSYLEFCVTVWDSLDPASGPQASTIHHFESGQTIGMELHVKDYDESGERTQQVWHWLFFGREPTYMAYTMGDLLSDFPLSFRSTLVDEASWADVKSRSATPPPALGPTRPRYLSKQVIPSR